MSTATQPIEQALTFPKCGHLRSAENSYEVKSHGRTYPACKTCIKARSDRRRLALKEEGFINRLGTQEQRDRIVETALEFYLSPDKPISKRHLYYKLRTHDNAQFVASLNLPRSSMENFSALVCSATSEACLGQRIPWECFIDPSRTVKKRTTWSSKKEFMRGMELSWDDSDITIDRPVHIECWIEKDALFTGLESCCYDNQINIRSCAGQAADDMIYRASVDFQRLNGKPIKIFYFGDLDKWGQDIENAIRRKFQGWYLFEGCDIALTRLGLTDKDARRLGIEDDPEVDALDDSDLQDRLLNAIKKASKGEHK
jgi:hypothetical protein